MAIVNIHEAKTHLSRILSRVQSGEEIIIAKAGKPIARLVSVEKKLPRRTPGTAKGRLTIKKSFFEPLPDAMLHEFEN
ncbi:MAG: type II toxin-antitoxin system Phd/YefM family antitoxin [Nitrospirota bacterium]